MTEDTIKRRAKGLDRAFDILDFLKEIGQPLRPNETPLTETIFVPPFALGALTSSRAWGTGAPIVLIVSRFR